MKPILFSLVFCCVPSLVWADRICVENATGKVIEYQSDARPGTLIANAKVSGYTDDQVKEREVTKEEWAAIREAQIDRPAREQVMQVKAQKRQKLNQLRTKLNLTLQEMDDLVEALR